MSNWKLVKLDFENNPAHFGELGIGMEQSSERVRSDTLFSAWLISYGRLGGNIEALLARFQKESEPPLRLSSTFLFRDRKKDSKDTEDSTIYYLPKPLKYPIGYPNGIGCPPEDDLQFAKEYRKLKFLPLSVWQRWYQGNGFEERDRQELIAKVKDGKSASTQLEDSYVFSYRKTYKIEKQPKVAIDRLTRATNLYYTSFVRYRSEEQNNSGLYFLIQFNDLSLENDFQVALALLGDEGLGGERSSGAGRFTPSWHDELPEIWQKVIDFSEGNCYSLMSLYWDNSIISLENSSYELQERGGWIASPFSGKQLRRKSVKMFTEGSTFITEPQGKLADVTPYDAKDNQLSEHRIYRSGISLSIPIKI